MPLKNLMTYYCMFIYHLSPNRIQSMNLYLINHQSLIHLIDLKIAINYYYFFWNYFMKFRVNLPHSNLITYLLFQSRYSFFSTSIQFNHIDYLYSVKVFKNFS